MSDNQDNKRLCLTLKKGKRICLGTNPKRQENESVKGSKEETRQKKNIIWGNGQMKKEEAKWNYGTWEKMPKRSR